MANISEERQTHLCFELVHANDDELVMAWPCTFMSCWSQTRSNKAGLTAPDPTSMARLHCTYFLPSPEQSLFRMPGCEATKKIENSSGIHKKVEKWGKGKDSHPVSCKTLHNLDATVANSFLYHYFECVCVVAGLSPHHSLIPAVFLLFELVN